MRKKCRAHASKHSSLRLSIRRVVLERTGGSDANRPPPEVQDRLVVVVAQEEEVRVIVKEHLEREEFLIKLLEDLKRKQKVGGQGRELQPPLRRNTSSLPGERS